MPHEITLVAGWAAGLVSLGALARYVFSTLRRKTKPNRVTWWILTLVGTLIAASYYAAGARHTMWVPVTYVLGPLVIAVLSITHGEGGWSRFDRLCVLAAGFSLALWWFSGSPLTALLFNLCIDFAGLLPTIRKSYLDPGGEDRLAWVLSFLASVVNLFAIERLETSVVLYPVYIAFGNGLIAILLLSPREKSGPQGWGVTGLFRRLFSRKALWEQR